MPVRIYEIAKKLGITSKELLAKARDIGIANARSASSSLDKITAEYLEEQFAQAAGGSGSEPEPEAAAEAPAAPVAEAVEIVTAPREEPDPEPEPGAQEDVSGEEEEAGEAAEAPAPEAEAEEVAAEGIEEEPEPAAGGTEEGAGEAQPEEQEPGLGAKVGFIHLTKGLKGRSRIEARRKQEAKARAARKEGRGGESSLPKPKYVASPDAKPLSLKQPIIVRNLAEVLHRKPFQIIADLMELNMFATVNQAIDEFYAKQICAKYGYRFEIERREKGAGVTRQQDTFDLDADDKESDLVQRPPVVTIMGHVDHGKTTLLDVIRKSNVVSGEAGGITQHIGAYTIHFPHPEHPERLQQITFLDTPGHAAFSAMRARGANVTDLVILVVAANDGVKPQTLEALNHAKAAHVPIIVAVNKIDLPGANPQNVRQQMQDHGLVCEEWGGETIFVDISALALKGIDSLLEMILLQAEILELKANPRRPAVGSVVESGMQQGGPIATVLVRRGTLRVGDAMNCGTYWGRVKALINEDGKRLKEAPPSVAVRVLGLNGAPGAGQMFHILPDEKKARKLAEERIAESRHRISEKRSAVTLENLFDTLSSDTAKHLRLVIKADTQGSAEAIADSLHKIDTSKVKLEIVHSGVGSLSESDVMLASASDAVVIGFQIRLDPGVSEAAKRESVQIKLYSIIYELIDEVKEAMAGLLDPITRAQVNGVAEIRKIFHMSKGSKVAGCMIVQGRFLRGRARVYRQGDLIYEGSTQSLRRFQDEANEVRSGFECGIRLDHFNDFQEGDTIESYSLEEVAQEL